MRLLYGPEGLCARTQLQRSPIRLALQQHHDVRDGYKFP